MPQADVILGKNQFINKITLQNWAARYRICTDIYIA